MDKNNLKDNNERAKIWQRT